MTITRIENGADSREERMESRRRLLNCLVGDLERFVDAVEEHPVAFNSLAFVAVSDVSSVRLATGQCRRDDVHDDDWVLPTEWSEGPVPSFAHVTPVLISDRATEIRFWREDCVRRCGSLSPIGFAQRELGGLAGDAFEACSARLRQLASGELLMTVLFADTGDDLVDVEAACVSRLSRPEFYQKWHAARLPSSPELVREIVRRRMEKLHARDSGKGRDIARKIMEAKKPGQ
jgi:hypothetical protein